MRRSSPLKRCMGCFPVTRCVMSTVPDDTRRHPLHPAWCAFAFQRVVTLMGSTPLLSFFLHLAGTWWVTCE